MAVWDILQGQLVQIPAIQLSDGQPFHGVVRAVQGDTIAIELEPQVAGLIPQKVDNNLVLTWKAHDEAQACPVLVRSKSTRAMVVQVVVQEKREAPRLRADVHLTYEVIPPDHVTAVAEEVLSKVNPLGEPISESSRLWRGKDDPLEQIRQEIASLRIGMETIMAKLDQLTALIVSGERPHSEVTIKHPLAIVNCSSTGMGFLSDEQYDQGQYLRLHLTLCTVPQVEIDCLSVVVRSKELEPDPQSPAIGRHDTGVRYTHIHESDREHLIHYLFKVQRRMLRDMKEMRDELLD